MTVQFACSDLYYYRPHMNREQWRVRLKESLKATELADSAPAGLKNYPPTAGGGARERSGEINSPLPRALARDEHNG